MLCIDKLFIILFLPYFVALEGSYENYVYQYDTDIFKEQIETMDGNFIMFYAPWCHHCTDFYPIWRELAELVNLADSKFAIAQVDCTEHNQLCNENDITGYPTLLYFHKNSFQGVEYKGTRDLPSLTLFLSEVFTMKIEGMLTSKTSNEVNIYSGMAYLNDYNIEKFISSGQHFIMFYTSWCKASQTMAPIWAELGAQYAHNTYVQIGKVNCMESPITCKDFDVKQYPYLLWVFNGRIMGVANKENTLDELKSYVDLMLLAENHDPNKFMKKTKVLPVARITEETFDTFLDADLVFINYFAPWCAHCMQLSPLWMKLGERFQNESRVVIADVDCARSKDICAWEKISGLPTLVLYKQKKIVVTEFGGKPLESLVALVQEQLDNLSTPEPTSEGTTNSSIQSTGQNNENTTTPKDEL